MVRIEPKRRQQSLGQRITDPRSPNDDVAVREVDDFENPVDHRVAERNERVEAADDDGRNQGFRKIRQDGIPLVIRLKTAELRDAAAWRPW